MSEEIKDELILANNGHGESAQYDPNNARLTSMHDTADF